MSVESNLPSFALGAVNLASEKLGAIAVDCSDDFFADKQRLLSDAEPDFHKGRFDAPRSIHGWLGVSSPSEWRV